MLYTCIVLVWQCVYFRRRNYVNDTGDKLCAVRFFGIFLGLFVRKGKIKD